MKKEVTYEEILSMFFDKFKPPVKKNERFKMNGKDYICTESSNKAFEYRGVKDPSDEMKLFRF